MLLILYNSTSGKGKGMAIAREVQALLKEEGVSYEVFQDAEWPDQIDHYASVWLIGGDGTINYFINIYPDNRLPIGLFPGGTGNDFYNNFHDHQDISKLVKSYLTPKTKLSDIGICNGKRFVNTIGIGFDGAVLKDIKFVRWIGGHLGYLLVVLKHILTWQPLVFSYSKDQKVFDEKRLLFFISNAPTTGGGFIISPKAKVDDGFLNVVTAGPVSILHRLLLLPQVERGKHLNHPKVDYWTTKHIDISMKKPTYYQMDGELRLDQIFEIRMIEKELSILI